MRAATAKKVSACVLGSACVLLASPSVRADQPAPPGATEAPTAVPDAPAEPEQTPAATTPATATDLAPTREAPKTPPAEAAGRWRYTAMLGVLAAPRVLALEPMGRYRRADDPRWDLFALGAAIEYLPPGIAEFGGPKLSWMQLAVEGRWFPWRFVWVGARAGWQFARADSVKYGSDVTYVTSGLIVGLRAGVLYTYKSGLTLGADIGATAPIAPKTSLDSDGTQDSGARKVANTFGQFVMPTVGLLRIGYTF